MKKIFKISGIVLGVLILVLILTGFIGYGRLSGKAKNNYAKLGTKAPELNSDSYTFRDLNKNGNSRFDL